MTEQGFLYAIMDFREARRKAALREIVARLTGTPVRLLSFEEVRQKLKAQVSSERGLHDIPLDAIVGSVNRYDDFTRDFLPRQDTMEQRWAMVKLASTDLAGLPPIEVYQIGSVYFVKDGNHRVSVARQLGATSIQAYVTEVRTPVPLTPDIRPEDLILKAEYAEFLEHTRMNEFRPQANLSLTAPGQYAVLEEHIAVHRYFMGLDFKRDISPDEAVAHWYDTVYLPVIRMIRQRGLLRDFPRRTETDLYLWIADHRAVLERELGWEIGAEAAAVDLAARFSLRVDRLATRLGEKVLDAVTPDPLEPGPPPGQWRKEKLAARRDDCLFCDILVPVSGNDEGWCALEQALIVARNERARLHGLHVVTARGQKNSAEAQAIRAHFEQRCQEADIPGNLVLVSGAINRKILERSRWNDLVIVNLAYPPTPQPLARYNSGFRTLIQRCPTPVLAVPQSVSGLSRALLAYDGSPKAQEALYVATYLAGQWKIPLVVVSILQEGRVTIETQEYAQSYLALHGVQATFVAESGSGGTTAIAAAILKTAEAHDSDLILMGGYSRGPLLNVFIDDVVDQVLRESRKPVLLCR